MYIGKNSSNYYQDEGYQIYTTEANYRANLTNIHIYNSSVEGLQYFDNSGYLNTTKQRKRKMFWTPGESPKMQMSYDKSQECSDTCLSVHP